jgi:hypothetical protein
MKLFGIIINECISHTLLERSGNSGLKENDFKVKLGSILENDIREYYFTNRFSYIEEKLAANISKGARDQGFKGSSEMIK